VTLALKFLGMMSHPLPDPVLDRVKRFVWGLEEGLQAAAHKVGSAIAEHPAFDARWVESPLIRALISSTAQSLAANGVRVESLANGGAEISITHDGIERRLRLKRADLDSYGRLDVRTSSDGILAATARDPSLFDDPDEVDPERVEQWVLAYLLHPGTRTFRSVSAGRVVGFLTTSPPYRLALADLVVIPHIAPPPLGFPSNQDDLDLGVDEDAERRKKNDRGNQAG
jgi:hypothetical protein